MESMVCPVKSAHISDRSRPWQEGCLPSRRFLLKPCGMAVSVKILTDFTTLNPAQRELLALFDRLGIVHQTYAHPPIMTVEEGLALNLHEQIPGQGGKNLLLTTDKGELWLVLVCEHNRADLKALSQRLGARRFSFAKPEVMLRVLGVTPGSATPFGLVNDVDREVKIAIDREFTQHSHCVFHPLRNSESTRIAYSDLLHFLNYLGYESIVTDIA